MTKHIAFLASGSGYGSWGTGATAAEAMKVAKKEWPGGKVRETKAMTCEVPDGMRLMVRSSVTGIEWWTEPIEPAPDVSPGMPPG